MNTQRDIYRQLIMKLIKENFDSALFVEKRDEMMKDSDFELIRDEIEEEYFTKNRGIAPYIKAIKYLCTKIEASTADNALFMPIEDYICVKENIEVTKIMKVVLQPEKVKPRTYKKRKGAKPTAQIQSENPPVHADCKSPHSCKKCRIMRRLNRPEVKTRKQSKKMMKEVTTNVDVKTENLKPEYSDISDSETTTSASETASKPKQNAISDISVQDHHKPCMQLPYFDHQYSRMSFYGSDMPEDLSKKREENKVMPEEAPVPKNMEQPEHSVFNSGVCRGESLPRPKHVVVRPKPIMYRFKPNNGLRQVAPAYYMPHYITTTPTSTAQSAPVRTIYKPHASIFANSTIPTQFRSPVTVLHRPVIHHPIYYVSFCEPQQLQRRSNDL